MERFVNPYNFIKFPEEKAQAYTEEDWHTGIIEYSITTKTPLFIPNSSSEKAFKATDNAQEPEHKSYDFFSYTELSEEERYAPKIAAELRKSGENIAEKTVGNYMRQMGIKAQWIKPYTQTTIDSDLSQKLKNILNEQFNPEHPDAVWCSDITYIWTYEGFVYLTSIMDLYSRKIISWVLSETLEASHVVKCIEKAKQSRHIENPLIFHCDRGCQYVSEAFRKATEGMIHSYSKKAYPWDNACIESFHALLKREWINRFKIFNYTHAYKLVFEYIETFYNTVRIHSHCGYLSPNEYEEEYQKNLKMNVTKLAS